MVQGRKRSKQPVEKVWPPVTGVRIMQTLFTETALNKNLQDILYLFNHCVLKTSCEAVVEGMGNIGDMHAAAGRLLKHKNHAAPTPSVLLL